MIALVPEMIYRLRPVGPLPRTDGAPTGIFVLGGGLNRGLVEYQL